MELTQETIAEVDAELRRLVTDGNTLGSLIVIVSGDVVQVGPRAAVTITSARNGQSMQVHRTPSVEPIPGCCSCLVDDGGVGQRPEARAWRFGVGPVEIPTN